MGKEKLQSGTEHQIYELVKRFWEHHEGAQGEMYTSKRGLFHLECDFAFAPVWVGMPNYEPLPNQVGRIYGMNIFTDDALGKGVIEIRCGDSAFTAQISED